MDLYDSVGCKSAYEWHFCMVFCTSTLVPCHISICVLNTYNGKMHWYFTILNMYYYLFDTFICKNYIFAWFWFDGATIFIFITKFLLFQLNFNLFCYFINILLFLRPFVTKQAGVWTQWLKISLLWEVCSNILLSFSTRRK